MKQPKHGVHFEIAFAKQLMFSLRTGALLACRDWILSSQMLFRLTCGAVEDSGRKGI